MILLDTNRTAATPKRRLVVVAVEVEFDCLARLKSSSTRSGWSRSSSSKEFSWVRRSIGSKERIMIVNISGPACDWRCLWPAERRERPGTWRELSSLHSGLHQFDGPWTELHKLYLKADKPEGAEGRWSCWIISAHLSARSGQQGDSMAPLLSPSLLSFIYHRDFNIVRPHTSLSSFNLNSFQAQFQVFFLLEVIKIELLLNKIRINNIVDDTMCSLIKWILGCSC